MARLVDAPLPRAPGLTVRVRKGLSGHGVRVNALGNPLSTKGVSGHSGQLEYQNRITTKNENTAFFQESRKYPEYPEYPDKPRNDAGLGCPGKPSPTVFHPDYPDSLQGREFAAQPSESWYVADIMRRARNALSPEALADEAEVTLWGGGLP